MTRTFQRCKPFKKVDRDWIPRWENGTGNKPFQKTGERVSNRCWLPKAARLSVAEFYKDELNGNQSTKRN